MRTISTAVLAASLLVGCTSAEEAGDDPEDSVFVEDSKADDFYSTSAAEYILEGKSTVVLDAAMASKPAAERLAAAKKLVGLKQTAIAWFVTQYLVAKEHDEANASFGGFAGMAKGGAYQDLGITERADKVTFDFTFRQLAAGGKNLMSQLPLRTVAGKPTFDLEIGRPSNTEMAQLETNAGWYRKAPGAGRCAPCPVAAIHSRAGGPVAAPTQHRLVGKVRPVDRFVGARRRVTRMRCSHREFWHLGHA